MADVVALSMDDVMRLRFHDPEPFRIASRVAGSCSPGRSACRLVRYLHMGAGSPIAVRAKQPTGEQVAVATREGTRIFSAADSVHVHQLLREALFHGDHVAQGLPDHGTTA